MIENRSDAPETKTENPEANNEETAGEASEETQRELEDEGNKSSFEDDSDADKVDEEEASDDSDSDGDGTDDAEEALNESIDDNEEDDASSETENDSDKDREELENVDEDKDGIIDAEESQPDKDDDTDEDGDGIVDAEKAKDDSSASERKDEKMSQESIDEVKARIKGDLEQMKNNPSGFGAFERNDTTYKNRSECKLSSKNFDRLMKERGLDNKVDKNGEPISKNIKSSFTGPMMVKHGYEGDRYTMMYGKEKKTGNFLSDETAREKTSVERQEGYALPPDNDASHIRDVKLAKDQFVVFGKVAPQEGFDKEANDGIKRTGGETQYVTDGGYDNGAVKDAYRSIDTIKSEMTQEQRDHYDKTDTHVGMVGDREALIRNDIDYNQVDAKGRTNLERMEKGLAPLDSSGKSIELHHMGQKMDAPIAELKREEHRGKGVDTILHDKNVDTDINRHDFDKERHDYWKERARQIKEERGEAA